jgi:hypothetical protein
MSWRFAATGLALPEKEHKTMIKFLNPAITHGPDFWHTRPASFFNIPSRRPVAWHFELPDPERRSLSLCQLPAWPVVQCPVRDHRNWVRFA